MSNSTDSLSLLFSLTSDISNSFTISLLLLFISLFEVLIKASVLVNFSLYNLFLYLDLVKILLYLFSN